MQIGVGFFLADESRKTKDKRVLVPIHRKPKDSKDSYICEPKAIYFRLLTLDI